MKKSIRIIITLLVVLLLLTGCGVSRGGRETKKVETVSSTSNTRGLKDANIEEKVIVDRDDIKVTVKSIKYDSSWGPEIKVLIENNGTRNIGVQTRNFSINGIMMEPSFSADVAAGKKANDSISISLDDLKVANITGIKDIEFDVLVFDYDSWDEIFMETGIQLLTDIKDYEQTYEVNGTLVVDQDNIR